jgi:hypothetical protein
MAGETGASSTAIEMSAEELAIARGDVLLDDDQEDMNDGDDQNASSDDADNNDSDAASSGDDDGGGDEDGQDEQAGESSGDEDDQDSGKQGDDTTIPRPRFDQVIAQRNEARQKLDDLEVQNKALLEVLQKAQQQGDVKPDATSDQQDGGDGAGDEQFDLQAKLQQYSEAVIDGDEKQAAGTLNEILQYQQKQAQEAAQQAVNSYAAGLDKKKAQNVANEIFTRHEEAFESKENLDDFIAWRDIFRNRGMSMQQALASAEEKLFGKSEGNSSEQDQNTENAQDQAKAEQKKKAVERNAQAAASQPPAMKGGSGQRSRSTPKTALDMSDKDYSNMSSEEKARARGDIAA